MFSILPLMVDSFTAKLKKYILPTFNKKCIGEVERIGSIVIFHFIELWKAKLFILCDAIFLVRQQGKFENWPLLGMKGLTVCSSPVFLSHTANSPLDTSDWRGRVITVHVRSRSLPFRFLFSPIPVSFLCVLQIFVARGSTLPPAWRPACRVLLARTRAAAAARPASDARREPARWRRQPLLHNNANVRTTKNVAGALWYMKQLNGCCFSSAAYCTGGADGGSGLKMHPKDCIGKRPSIVTMELIIVSRKHTPQNYAFLPCGHLESVVIARTQVQFHSWSVHSCWTLKTKPRNSILSLDTARYGC